MAQITKSIFSFVSGIERALGLQALYVVGLICFALAIILIILEVFFRKTPVFEHGKLVLKDNGVRWTPRELIIAAVVAAVFAASLSVTAGVQLIPGFVQARPANAFMATFGLLFGVPGAVGLALGNVLGDILSGTFTLGSFGGAIGVFMTGYLPYKLIRDRGLSTTKTIVWFLVVELITSVFGLAFPISSWLETVRILPLTAVWYAAFPAIWLTGLYPNWIIAPILIRVLYKPFAQRGWVASSSGVSPSRA